MDAESADEPVVVTRRHLERAEELCPRRVAAERVRTRESQLNKAANLRYEVSQRIENDVRLAHSEMRAPRAGDFPAARDLYPEQQRVHAAAASGYLALFADADARTVATVDPMSTELDDVGVRLTGSIGVALETPSGPELRMLRIGRRDGAELLGRDDVWFALLRAGDWAEPELRIVAADLLTLETVPLVVDTTRDARNARTWFDARLSSVEAIVARAKPPRGLRLSRLSGRRGMPCAPRILMPRRRALGDIVTITPTSVETAEACIRRFFLAHVLGIPESDDGPDAISGLRIHALLRMIDEHGDARDESHVASVLGAHESDDDHHRAIVARHAQRLPSEREREGFEVDLARFHLKPVPMFMATARIDAVFVHDGVLDARDYKTGKSWHLRVADDPRAHVQAWILARHARRLDVRLQLRYEHTALEVEDDPDPWEPSEDDLEAVEESLRQLAVRLWEAANKEEWRGIADPAVCGSCRFRSVCSDSAAPGEARWPVLSIDAGDQHG